MFEKIIGNEQIKQMLESSIKNRSTSHSYLFIGIQGIGKKLLATEFAKRILCLEDKQSCQCKSCIEFEGNNNPDFMCIEPDGNSIKIEQIRYLQKKIQEKPILSNKKVYIINDAETMTTEAQNCLLKTLEEPPEFAVIVLIGSNENAFLPTIKSRCMILRFQTIEDNEIKKYMEINYGMTNLNQSYIAMTQGSIGKAILLKDKQEEYQNIEQIIENLQKKNLIEITRISRNII